MASREKRPLAPSKSKQKANNDGTLPLVDQKSRKAKVQTNTRHQQFAQEILEAVATSSQLPAKYNASLSRKKALATLRLKPKLKATRSTIIKGKIIKKPPIRTLRKTNTGTTGIIKGKRTRKLGEEEKSGENINEEVENNGSFPKSGTKAFESKVNALKNSLKVRRVKHAIKNTETHDNVTETTVKDGEATSPSATNAKNSPKSTRRVKITDKKAQNTVTEDTDDNSENEGKGTDNFAKNIKASKTSSAKRNPIKDKDNNSKGVVESDSKDASSPLKSTKFKRNTSKERDIQAVAKSASISDTKSGKVITDNKNLVDLTIDEVIASTVVGSEEDRIAKKYKKGKKIMDKNEKLLSEVDIKKEPDSEEMKIIFNESGRDSENGGDSLKSGVSRGKYSGILTPRSLRNGKLRKSTELGLPLDSETQKQYKLSSDDPAGSDSGGGDSSLEIIGGDISFVEFSLDNSRSSMNSSKNQKMSEDAENTEVGNNNNEETGDGVEEVGPTLRSKTKNKTSDGTSVTLDGKSTSEESRSPVKSSGTQDDSKKMLSTEQGRKENALSNISERPASRRSSLNLDMKKTVGSFYSSEKSDNPKSIDQMIENIKLNIAKAIESKIFGAEKNLVLNKNVEIAKTEEIVAPLSSTDSQKKSLEEKEEEKTANVSKSEMKTESTENSVPRVADTAKEIEKLVMGDMEIADTHLENQPKTSNDNRTASPIGCVTKVFKIETSENSAHMGDVLSTSASKHLDSGNCSSDPSSTEIKHSDINPITRINSKTTLSEDNRSNDGQTDKSNALRAPEVDEKMTDHRIKLAKNPSSDSSSTVRSDQNTSGRSAVAEDSGSLLKTIAKPMQLTKTQNCPQSRLQSEESETLESISREVEKLVAESQSDGETMIESPEKSRKQPDVTEKKCTSTNPNSTKAVELNKEKCQDSNDISDTEPETNRFPKVFESSSSDSNVFELTSEISEVSVSTEVPASSSIASKDTIASEKITQESENKITLKNQDVVPRCKSEIIVPDTVVFSQNLLVRSESSLENTEHPSEIPSQCLPHISHSKETTESGNLSSKKKLSDASQDKDSKFQNSINKNAEKSEDYNKKIENIRCSTVSGETSSEKHTNDPEISLHVPIEASRDDSSYGGETMKKELHADNTDKQITAEEQKCIIEENKRVLRARDRQKRMETVRKLQDIAQIPDPNEKNSGDVKSIKQEESEPTKSLTIQTNEGSSSPGVINNTREVESNKQISPVHLANKEDLEKTEIVNQETIEGTNVVPEPLIRTRRSREVKKRKDEQSQNVTKTKRSKKDNRKSDQQNKEETLLDNEVAKINENNQSMAEKYEKPFKVGENFRGFSEDSSKPIFIGGKVRKNDPDRSHSETDLEIVKLEMENGQLSKKVVDRGNQSRNSEALSENDKKTSEPDVKTPETLQKDLDESSTSSESSNGAIGSQKILETPEDKAKKESILRLLGLESLEKAAERLNQKAKKEQYTGTLKTVIRVQKEKDKKRSRSPLKMVLKQGRNDGDGDSPEFYTIQKELGTSGLGDSSSGANRKFSTNHRHSCDEDPEEPSSKDRQSLVIPEKSSSFSIHPGRLCADVCCYCFGKFGSLDTPMHLAQMKSDERRQKILNIERHLTKDSCLCDACYRHVDRKANTSPTNMQSKPQRQHRQLMVSKCSAKDCRESARHHVKRRWLLKIKTGLQNQVNIDWESSQHTSMPFCVDHYSKIERFLTCALCKRRLARTHTHQLVAAETDELNDRLKQQGIPVPLSAGTFVCKLCRYFTQLQLKYKDIENMNANHKTFFKSYRKRILHYHDIEVLENEDEDSSSQGQSAKDKEKRKKTKCGPGKSGSSKSVDNTNNSTSEKSTPEPNKTEGTNSETDNYSFLTQNSSAVKNGKESLAGCRDVEIISLQESLESVKKRKSVEMQAYSSSSSVSGGTANDFVEILAMDKEVTLTRIPKRARTHNDITPVVQRLGANPSISVRTLFPGEEEMNLHANIEFNNVREVTPQGWEKCATMIQYDRDTKLLWQELQRPYGNQSSFLRHLILLEKYYRSGDLVLAPNASRNAINYSTSVQNRLISYEGPEKMDEPILEPIASEFANPRRLSGGFMLERDRLSMPSTSSYPANATAISQNASTSFSTVSKTSPPRPMKLNPGVSIIKKPPPNLHRLSLPSTSTGGGSSSSTIKRTDNRMPVMSGGKVFQLSEPEFKRLQTLKKQKQLHNEKQSSSGNMTSNSSGSASPSSPQNRPATQYQKAQIAAQTQFQKHLRAQQEMLNRQSRSDFEPLICDVRPIIETTSQTQNLINNLNLPRSIQVTTKPSNTIPIMPKIPKSLTVIPQTITRPTDK